MLIRLVWLHAQVVSGMKRLEILGYTMGQIADFFGVHYMTVSRAVRENEKMREMLEC